MIDVGDVYRLKVEITDEDDQLADPTTIAVTVTLPDGTTDTPDVIQDSTGVYHADYEAVQAGRHVGRWESTGTAQAAYTDAFDVADTIWQGIISLADAKAQLNITSATNDDELRDFILGASRVVEGYVGDVIQRTYTETFSGSGTNASIVLTHEPILSVTSVTDTGTPLSSDQYSLNNGVLTRILGITPFVFTAGRDNIVVTYVAGRRIIPPNFTLATRIIVQHLWETQRGSIGTTKFGGSTANSRYGGVDDVLIQPGFSFSVPRRAVELLERDMLPSGIA